MAAKKQTNLVTTQNLFHGLNQEVSVLFFKDQGGSQSNRVLGTSADVDTLALHVDQKLVSQGRLSKAPGNESSSVLASQVLEESRVFGLESLQLGEQVATNSLGDSWQVVLNDLSTDSTTQEHSGWVTAPGVELTVRHVGGDLVVMVVVASGLELLREGDQVWWRSQLEVFVGPQLTSWTDTGLDLVHDQQGAVLQGQVSQALEEVVGAVVVATLGLNGFDQQSSNWRSPRLEQGVDNIQAAVVFLEILGLVLVQGVLVAGELSLWPLERWEVQLVDWLRAGDRARSKESSVEGSLERHDSQVRRAWSLVLHDSGVLLSAEGGGVASLLALIPHESGLESQLVGISARQGGPDFVLAFWGDLQQALDNPLKVLAGVVALGWSVDNGIDHHWRLSSLNQSGIVVAQGDGRDLGVDVQVQVAVDVDEVVAQGLLVVSNEVDGPGVENLTQGLLSGLGGLSGECSNDLWGGWLVGEVFGANRRVCHKKNG